MKKRLTVLALVLGVAWMPVVHAAEEAEAEPKVEQKETTDKKEVKTGDSGEKKDEKKGSGGSEPGCN